MRQARLTSSRYMRTRSDDSAAAAVLDATSCSTRPWLNTLWSINVSLSTAGATFRIAPRATCVAARLAVRNIECLLSRRAWTRARAKHRILCAGVSYKYGGHQKCRMLSYSSPDNACSRDYNLEQLLAPRDGWPATAVVGRHRSADIVLDCERTRGRPSRTHGFFSLDSAGVLRFTDLSAHGTVILPRTGPPRMLQPHRHTMLLAGDALALGDAHALGTLLTVEAAAALLKMHALRLASPCAAADSSPYESRAEDECVAACSCSVCHEPLRGTRVLPCGHAFCDDCITRWFREHTTCPSCRAPCDARVVETSGVPCLQMDCAARAAVARSGDARALLLMDEYEHLSSLRF